MTRRWVVYPFLLAIYPIVAVYAHNAHETPTRELVVPIAWALVATAVAWAVLALALRQAHRAGLVVVLLVVFFYTINRAPGVASDTLEELTRLWVHSQVPVRPSLAIGVEAAAIGGLAYVVARRLRRPEALTPFLNVFATILLLLPASSATLARAKEPARPVEIRGGLPALTTGAGPKRPPDIYYIILDGYARSDVLRRNFGLDNEPFLQHLEGKGFFVARRSTANYCQTPLCLASSLNARYLDGLVDPGAHDTNATHELIARNAVAKTLRRHGYRFVSFSSGFPQSEAPEADVYLTPNDWLSPFQRMLVEGTLLESVMPGPLGGDGYTMTRVRSSFLLETVPRIADDPGPTFTFAHLLAPHPPFVFGEDGSDVSPHDIPYRLTDGSLYGPIYGDRDSFVRGYRAEASYLTARVEHMIDEILARSPEPPVIIVQSDHGSGLRLDVDSLEKTDLRERMSILNAYHFPGATPAALHDRISPVNSFRVLLNALFGSHLELLPDASYFSTWAEPYRFIDVTDRVRSPSTESVGEASTPAHDAGAPAAGILDQKAAR
jgi:hypothetical protein